MKYYSNYKHPKDLGFIIEDEGDIGFCLYVYEHQSLFDSDLRDERGCPSHQRDYLQDTVEMAQRYARNHFDVPLDSWVIIEQ